MIAVDQLRYVRLGTPDLPAAIDFAQRILGLQLIERSDSAAYFRSDLRDHTLVYTRGEPADKALGLEIYGQEQFEAAIATLSQRGFDITRGNETAVNAGVILDQRAGAILHQS
jgi:2,3-dihydroxy-p-cumate/2,3-dihydroxybenzoate 3,4-dioxygenase